MIGPISTVVTCALRRLVEPSAEPRSGNESTRATGWTRSAGEPGALRRMRHVDLSGGTTLRERAVRPESSVANSSSIGN